MELVLARIDDRFIHGQVVVGWCRRLAPDRLLLCHDDIAADPWQCAVYASSVPPSYRVQILSRHETAALWQREACDDKVLLLTGSPVTMLWLHAAGLPLREVNVGGMHPRRGSRPLLPDVHGDARDREALVSLLAVGVRLFVQTVPGAPRRDVTPADLREAAS